MSVKAKAPTLNVCLCPWHKQEGLQSCECQHTSDANTTGVGVSHKCSHLANAKQKSRF